MRVNLAFGADIELVRIKEEEAKSEKFVHVPKNNVQLETLAAADENWVDPGSESEVQNDLKLSMCCNLTKRRGF